VVIARGLRFVVVTVNADPDHFVPAAATPSDAYVVDMRSSAAARAGALLYEADDLVTGWHAHDLHQLEFALGGVAHVEADGARYLLPPHQAVWIPSGHRHCTTLLGVRSIAVFFEPSLVDVSEPRVHVLAVTPLLREMICYAVRWPIDRAIADETADRFFDALSLLLREWISDPAPPLCLPSSDDPVVADVIARTEADLPTVTSTDIASAAGISERTLRRRFAEVTGITWQQYVQTSRVMRAMVHLVQTNVGVLEVAHAVGYGSVSAFTRAFRHHTGESPTQYRRRITEIASHRLVRAAEHPSPTVEHNYPKTGRTPR
jgi:AraC-like DNA-binding protein